METIREGHAAFNRGDNSWATTAAAEEVEWLPTGSFPGLEGVYRGPEAIERWMETIRAEWEEFGVSLAEVLEEGDDVVLIAERLWGRGRESGAEAEMTIFAIYRFNPQGKIVRREAYTSREAALAAL